MAEEFMEKKTVKRRIFDYILIYKNNSNLDSNRATMPYCTSWPLPNFFMVLLPVTAFSSV